MCSTCGCGTSDMKIEGLGHSHHHDGLHYELPHKTENGVPTPLLAHAPGMSPTRMVKVEQDILETNNAYAANNRRAFLEHGIFTLNLVSSPGSGKTALLTATIVALQGRMPIAVIEGDQQTSRDADRIRATGVPTVQINTGKGCHLDAHAIGHALQPLKLADDTLLLIENVGNLVCPAAFDLGEAHKVAVLSVTEGEDKPLKYPDMFQAADVLLLNKVDLLPYVDFNVEKCIEYARSVHPGIRVLPVSALRGDGMQAWLDWLEQEWRGALLLKPLGVEVRELSHDQMEGVAALL